MTKKNFTKGMAGFLIGFLLVPALAQAIGTAAKYDLNNNMGPVARKYQLGTLIESAENSLAVLANGETILNGTDDTVQITSEDEAIVLNLLGYESRSATLSLWADQGDNADDKWSLVAGTDATLKFKSDSTTLLTFSTDGDVTFPGTTPTVTVGDAGAEDAGIVFDGNAQDFNISLDDSTDDLVIGLGTAAGTTDALRIDENQVVTFMQDPVFAGTTPYLTVGDAGAEDAGLLFDGNAVDFNLSLDDSADKLVIGLGTAAGTTNRMAFNSADLNIVLGDASAADMSLVFDGNAQDFNIGLDDSTDDLVIGLGTAPGTTDAIRIDENQVVKFLQDPVLIGTTPYLTIGDAGAEDAGLVFDGNAQDFNISLDDSTDDLVIGLGTAGGTTDAIRIDENQDVTFVQNVFGLGTDSLSGFLQKQVAATTVGLTAAQCGSTIVGASDGNNTLTLPEASTVLGCRYTVICGGTDDLILDVADGTDQIAAFWVITTTSANANRAPSAGEGVVCSTAGNSIVVEAIGANLWGVINTPQGIWAEETP